MILIIQKCAIQDILHVLHLQVNFPKPAKTKLIYKNFQPIAIFNCFLSHSAHRTTNFTNPEFQSPQFKVLQNVFIYFLI